MPVQTPLSVATHSEPAATRHAVGIAIKKWRYFFEIFEHILDGDYAAIVYQLKGHKSLLGIISWTKFAPNGLKSTLFAVNNMLHQAAMPVNLHTWLRHELCERRIYAFL